MVGTLLFEVDEDYAGGAFIADYTSPAIDGDDGDGRLVLVAFFKTKK